MSVATGTMPASRVVVLVLFWVRIYTCGLPSEARERRISQITSDLWEHYEDRRRDGLHPASINFEALGRAARGALADLFWRFQLEGPQMHFDFPLQRVGGACLLLLVAAAALAVAAAGYDTSADGFDGELRRLAEVTDTGVLVYSLFLMLAGVGMIGGACLVFLYLSGFARVQALLASVALGAAGLMALVTCGLYATTAELADEFVATAPERADSVLVAARGFMLLLSNIGPSMILLLSIAVLGFALIMGRHGLVPKWLGFVALASAVMVPSAGVASIAGIDTAAWVTFSLGFVLLLLWLVIAGGWLLLGGSRPGSNSPSGIAGAAATSGGSRVPSPGRHGAIACRLRGCDVWLQGRL